MFKTKFNANDGEVLATYLHNKTSPTIGKIGTIFVSYFLSKIIARF